MVSVNVTHHVYLLEIRNRVGRGELEKRGCGGGGVGGGWGCWEGKLHIEGKWFYQPEKQSLILISLRSRRQLELELF